jgi:hypothetical protein
VGACTTAGAGNTMPVGAGGTLVPPAPTPEVAAAMIPLSVLLQLLLLR